ncbi:hypothetical protein BJX64DRAFT_294014 [Aspergillus heterothallicus]
MTSLLSRSTGIRNPRAAPPRTNETPSPVVSEGFQSEIIEGSQGQGHNPGHSHGRKREDSQRERRLAGYTQAVQNPTNLPPGRVVASGRRGSTRTRGAAGNTAVGEGDKVVETETEIERGRGGGGGGGGKPTSLRRKSLKRFPTESTREVWLTNEPKNLEEEAGGGGGETVVMVGDSQRHHIELAKLYGFCVGDGGKVLDDEGRAIGRVVEGEPEDLVGQTVDEDGEILDEDGDLIGRVDVVREEDLMEEETREQLRELQGLRTNKQGNVMNADGVLVAQVVSGTAVADQEIGENGRLRDDNGEVVAMVELIPEEDRVYAIVRQMRDAINPLRRQMKLANKRSRVLVVGGEIITDMKPLVEEARRALQECETALRAQTVNKKNMVDQQLADLIHELGESIIETVDNACQIIADSQNKYYIHPLITMLVEPPLHITVAIALRVVGFYARILNTVGIGKVLRVALRRLGIYQRLEEVGLGVVIEVLELGSVK